MRVFLFFLLCVSLSLVASVTQGTKPKTSVTHELNQYYDANIRPYLVELKDALNEAIRLRKVSAATIKDNGFKKACIDIRERYVEWEKRWVEMAIFNSKVEKYANFPSLLNQFPLARRVLVSSQASWRQFSRLKDEFQDYLLTQYQKDLGTLRNWIASRRLFTTERLDTFPDDQKEDMALSGLGTLVPEAQVPGTDVQTEHVHKRLRDWDGSSGEEPNTKRSTLGDGPDPNNAIPLSSF